MKPVNSNMPSAAQLARKKWAASMGEAKEIYYARTGSQWGAGVHDTRIYDMRRNHKYRLKKDKAFFIGTHAEWITL